MKSLHVNLLHHPPSPDHPHDLWPRHQASHRRAVIRLPGYPAVHRWAASGPKPACCLCNARIARGRLGGNVAASVATGCSSPNEFRNGARPEIWNIGKSGKNMKKKKITHPRFWWFLINEGASQMERVMGSKGKRISSNLGYTYWKSTGIIIEGFWSQGWFWVLIVSFGSWQCIPCLWMGDNTCLKPMP